MAADEPEPEPPGFKDPICTTPQMMRLARPNLLAFHSTGLIAKKQRTAAAAATHSVGPRTQAAAFAAHRPHSTSGGFAYLRPADVSIDSARSSSTGSDSFGVLATPLFQRSGVVRPESMLSAASSVPSLGGESPLLRLHGAAGMVGAAAHAASPIVGGYRSPLSVKTSRTQSSTQSARPRTSLLDAMSDEGSDGEEVENWFAGLHGGATAALAAGHSSPSSRAALGAKTQRNYGRAEPPADFPSSSLASSSPRPGAGAAPLTPVSGTDVLRSRLYSPYPRFLTLEYIRQLRETQQTSRSLALVTSPAAPRQSSSAAATPETHGARSSSPTAPRQLYPPSRHDDTADYFETHFSVLARLGEGSFAEAFLVRCAADARLYAVKRTRQAYTGYRDRVRKLEEVFQHFSVLENGGPPPEELRHRFYWDLVLPRDGSPPPRLVRLLQAWEQHGILYMQLELCERGSLQTFLERYCAGEPFGPSPRRPPLPATPLSSSLGCDDDVEMAVPLQTPSPARPAVGGGIAEEQIWGMLVELVLGLRAIHLRGKLHLDLKPANVFITSDWHLKIGDFGLAADLPLQRDAETEGDRIYIAPEVLEGVYSPAADVFSLGLIVFEMAANVVLPENGSAWRRLRAGDLLEVPFPSYISHGLQHLIYMMLAPRVSERITLDQILELPPVQELLHRAVRAGPGINVLIRPFA